MVALQRQTHSPKVIHHRRLNALVRVAQRIPARIVFQAMECSRLLEVHSDAGFSKEQESGYGIRGTNFVRGGTRRGGGQKVWHLLDSQRRSHKHVTRCSFSSETRAAVVAADEQIALAVSLHEIAVGPAFPAPTRRLRDSGEFVFNAILVVDSMPLWSAPQRRTWRSTSSGCASTSTRRCSTY